MEQAVGKQGVVALPASTQPDSIEIGWLILGSLEQVDRDAVAFARDAVHQTLSEPFPDYAWKMPMVEHRDLVQSIREEPMVLLDAGLIERDARHWDFVLVIAGADLVSHYKPFALATPSRAMGVAVISTVRIDPLASGPAPRRSASRRERCRLMSRRLEILALHLLGHLSGVEHESDPRSVMYDFQTIADIDRVHQAREHPARQHQERVHKAQERPVHAYSERARARLASVLPAIADLRLEEQRSWRGRVPFYMRAAWRQRGDIANAIRMAAPWKFPLRLGRFTTAALSAVVVLINTAETWELALAQTPATMFALSALVLAATTWYMVKRQNLLLERTHGRLTEQTVITRLSAIISVGMGLVGTYATLFVLIAALAAWVIPASIVADWANMNRTCVSLSQYLLLAGFLGALGIAVGALGASFEKQHYVRHVTFVDEET